MFEVYQVRTDQIKRTCLVGLPPIRNNDNVCFKKAQKLGGTKLHHLATVRSGHLASFFFLHYVPQRKLHTVIYLMLPQIGRG